MKTILIIVVSFIMSLFFYQAQAQIKITSKSVTTQKIQELINKKEEVKAEEKAKLKEEVEAINERLEKGEISSEEAGKLKKEAAERRALNIGDKLNIIDSKIALLQRNEADKKTHVSIGFWLSDEEEGTEVVDSIPVRTTSDLLIAFGFNNAIIEGRSLDESPYKIGGSRFFEIGYEFSTNLFESGFVRLKYGLSFQFNGLKPEDNQYFVENGKQTSLEEYPISLNKSKFRNDNLVIPIHLEFGPSTIVQDDGKAYYSTEDQFKFGVGGFLGLNLNTVQKLKYKHDGDREKIKLKESYNTTNLIYGLSAYLGYDWYTLYIKYNLNPIFTDNTVEQHTISVGVRLLI